MKTEVTSNSKKKEKNQVKIKCLDPRKVSESSESCKVHIQEVDAMTGLDLWSHPDAMFIRIQNKPVNRNFVKYGRWEQRSGCNVHPESEQGSKSKLREMCPHGSNDSIRNRRLPALTAGICIGICNCLEQGTFQDF